MHLDANSVAQTKAFADLLRQVVSKINAGGYTIDESGDTLNTLVGLVVTKMGAEAYNEAIQSAAFKVASTEKDKIVAMLNSVVESLDRMSGMSDSILGMMGQFGISSVQWAGDPSAAEEDEPAAGEAKVTLETIPTPCLVTVMFNYANERPDQCVLDISKLPKDHELLPRIIKAINSEKKYGVAAYEEMQDNIHLAVVKNPRGMALFDSIELHESEEANGEWEIAHEDDDED